MYFMTIICLFLLFHLTESFISSKILSNNVDNRSYTSIKMMSEKQDILKEFLIDAESLGQNRFVVVGNGAILESVGSFNELRYAETPKGLLATFSTEDNKGNNNFELHLRVNEIESIKFLEIEKFDKVLHIIRFCGQEGQTHLSAILAHDDDSSDSDDSMKSTKVQEWKHLKDKYEMKLR